MEPTQAKPDVIRQIVRENCECIRHLPASMIEDNQMHCACIGGAALVANLRQTLEAGVEAIKPGLNGTR